MSKRTIYTESSPLPSTVSRELALEFLHNHVEMIDLNPLIKERHPIPVPPAAPAEERHCAWYSLTDEITYLPGGIASGDVSYTAAFNDLPHGIQTHCYAPLGVDIRSKWTVCGSLPGEPPERAEIGIGAPTTGLYIREDVELRCNLLMSSFIKKTTKKAHQALVDHLVRKAAKMAADRAASTAVIAASPAPATATTTALSSSSSSAPALAAACIPSSRSNRGASVGSFASVQGYVSPRYSPPRTTLNPSQGGHGRGHKHSLSEGSFAAGGSPSASPRASPTPAALSPPLPEDSSPYYPAQRRWSPQPLQEQLALTPPLRKTSPPASSDTNVPSAFRALAPGLASPPATAPQQAWSPPPPAYAPSFTKAPSPRCGATGAGGSPATLRPGQDESVASGLGLRDHSAYPSPLHISKSNSTSSSVYGSLRHKRSERDGGAQQQPASPASPTRPSSGPYPEMSLYGFGGEADERFQDPSDAHTGLPSPPSSLAATAAASPPVIAELPGSESRLEDSPRIMMGRNSMQPYDSHPLALRPGSFGPSKSPLSFRDFQ